MTAQTSIIPGFELHTLGDGSVVHSGRLPDNLFPTNFEAIWQLRPTEPQYIQIHGRRVEIPRRQKAYGRDYQFSGQIMRADETPPILLAYLNWAKSTLETGLNAMLVNWYAGSDYIGPHHDDSRPPFTASPLCHTSTGSGTRGTPADDSNRELRPKAEQLAFQGAYDGVGASSHAMP